MHFRRAEARDADRIAQLHAESWRRTYRGMMRDEFLDGDVLTITTAPYKSYLDGREGRSILIWKKVK